MAKLRIPFIDYSDEGSTSDFPVGDARTVGELEPFRVALVALTYDGDQEALRIGEDAVGGTNSGKSTNPEGQREKKWLFHFHRTSDASYNYTREMPCADLTNLDSGGEIIDLTVGVGATLKTQFELNCVDPRDASAVTLTEVEFVGRNI